MKHNHFLLCLFSLLLTSCIFSPDKENFVEINQEVLAPVVTDYLLDLKADTIRVWKPTRFNFDFKSSKQKILGVEVVFGGKKQIINSRTGSFEINPSTLNEGTSEMEIKVITESGTGSMADKIGAEGFELKKTWVLIIERAVAPAIHISTSIENGYLKFTWNSMDKAYIRSLRYFVEMESSGMSVGKENIDKKVTSIVDSTYVGGKVNFRFFVYYEDASGSYSSAIKNFSYEYPCNVTYRQDREHLTFSWPKSPFHRTTDFSFPGGRTIEIKTDTFVTVSSLGLGQEVYYGFLFKSSQQPENASQYLRYTIGVSGGTKDGLLHKNVEYNPALNTYFFKNVSAVESADQSILPLNIYNYPDITNDWYSLTFSADNEKLYTTEGKNLVTLNASTLNVISSTPLSPVLPDYYRSLVLKHLQDQTFLMGYQTSSEVRFALINPESGTILAQSKGMGHTYSNMGSYVMNISPDGKYAAITTNNGFYLFENVGNTQLVLRYQDSQSCINALFDPQHPERLIINRVGDIEVFNCSTLQVERTIALLANPINFDPQTHYLLMVSGSNKKIYVYDYENDVVKFEIAHYGNPADFKLINNIIFVNAGYHFDIN